MTTASTTTPTTVTATTSMFDNIDVNALAMAKILGNKDSRADVLACLPASVVQAYMDNQKKISSLLVELDLSNENAKTPLIKAKGVNAMTQSMYSGLGKMFD